jgi:hypothetical protein
MHMPPEFPIPDFPKMEINDPDHILSPTADIAILEFLL